MSEFWTFAMAHPYLWFLGFIVTGTIVVTMTTECICRLARYAIRLVNIWKNGWPPPHCDSDGDLKQ